MLFRSEIDFPWEFGETHQIEIQVTGKRLRAWVDSRPIFDLQDHHRPLETGAVALVCEEGRTATHVVRIQPVNKTDDT